nr:hypothetical protein [Sulfuricurvum sp. IAE1]
MKNEAYQKEKQALVAAGYSEEEAAAMANSTMEGWDASKEFIGGAAALAGGFGARSIYERLKANPPSHHPTMANATGASNPSQKNRFMDSSLTSNGNNIITNAENLHNSAVAELKGVQDLGAAGIGRQETAARLAKEGAIDLANKVLSGANVTGRDFEKAGLDPKDFNLKENMLSDIGSKKTQIGIDFQSAGQGSFDKAIAAEPRRVRRECGCGDRESAVSSQNAEIQRDVCGDGDRPCRSGIGGGMVLAESGGRMRLLVLFFGPAQGKFEDDEQNPGGGEQNPERFHDILLFRNIITR